MLSTVLQFNKSINNANNGDDDFSVGTESLLG